MGINAQFPSFCTYALVGSQWSTGCSGEYSEFSIVCRLSIVFVKLRNAKFGSALNQVSGRNLPSKMRLINATVNVEFMVEKAAL